MDKQRIEDILRVFEDCVFAKRCWTDKDRIEFIVDAWEDAKEDLYNIGIEVE